VLPWPGLLLPPCAILEIYATLPDAAVITEPPKKLQM